ncbi:MAG: amino acid adenylation domain-containing protein, partial [Blastocatellia bacterium]
VVGSPAAGRTHAGFDRVVGYFVNPVPMRANFSAGLRVDGFAEQVRETALGAIEHQDYPFSLLVDLLQVQRDPARSPLFQVMFVYQSSNVFGEGGLGPFALGAPSGRIEMGELVLESMALDETTAQYDLTLTVAETRDGLAASLGYNTDLFDARTMVRMSGHFLTLIDAVLSEGSRLVSFLPLLSSYEEEQLLSRVRAIPNYSLNDCVHRLFEAQVARTPDSVALVYEGEETTYLELNSNANKLAHYLMSIGAGPETPVAVCVERSTEMVVCLLAVLKAGGAYVPLDRAYPKQRLAHILEDSGASILLTQSQAVDGLPQTRGALVCVDTDLDAISNHSSENPDGVTYPENAAYVIYTSGSTGAPKGVAVTHYNVARLFESTKHWFQFDELDVWSLYHSYAFDFSVWELWGALFSGGKLVVTAYWVSRSPDLFLELVASQRVTILNQTPSAFKQLIDADRSARTQAGLALRVVIFAGELLDLQSLQPWFERHGEAAPALANMYGITETTVHVTFRRIYERDTNEATASPIGEPIPDLRVYVLDDQLQLLPYCVPGQIFVAGAGLARGYIGRADLTADRFLPESFSQESGARMYASGDVCRYTTTGDLQYLGRADHQVKIRGFRIELGEIAAVLTGHPAVAQAVVLMLEELGAEKQLAAYIVPERALEVKAGELREFLKQSLPGYMVPAAFVMLEGLPLTPNGKLDRAALPAPDDATRMAGNLFQAPRTLFEETLAKIWSAVLRVDQVSVFDNFFELGGDSILSIQVVSRARQVGLALTPRLLFEHQTVADLATLATPISKLPPLEAPRPDTQPPGTTPKAEPDIEDAYPLSPMQQGMLFHTLYAPDSGVYCTQLQCDLEGNLGASAFEQAWQTVLARHPSLRASFEWDGIDQTRQVIRPGVNLPLVQTDWMEIYPDRLETLLDQHIELDREHGFQLDRPPLMRLLLMKIAEGKYRILWSYHHSLLDGWSIPSVLEEVFACYEAYRSGSNPVLPERRPFKDYIFWLQAQDSQAA